MSRSSRALNRHTPGNRVHGVGVIREYRHDPYHRVEKRPDGTRCVQCGAVVEKGAWRWQSQLPASQKREESQVPSELSVKPEMSPSGVAGLCPACERIRGHDAAGVLIIEASVIDLRVDQFQSTLKHIVAAENEEHPMERILSVQEMADGAYLVETTGLHLLRRLGHGLASAFSAHLRTVYLEAQHKGVMRLSI